MCIVSTLARSRHAWIKPRRGASCCGSRMTLRRPSSQLTRSAVFRGLQVESIQILHTASHAGKRAGEREASGERDHLRGSHTLRSTGRTGDRKQQSAARQKGRTAGLGREAVHRVVALAHRADRAAERKVRARAERAAVLIDVRDHELHARVVLRRDQAACESASARCARCAQERGRGRAHRSRRTCAGRRGRRAGPVRVPRERRRPADKVGADLVVLHFCEVGRDDAKDDEEEGRRVGAPRCADTVQFVVACPQSVMSFATGFFFAIAQMSICRHIHIIQDLLLQRRASSITA
jgi:hypothetical protein